jgi:xylulokinase
MKTVVGIDLGTQSIKVLFYRADTREVVASASHELELITDADGRAEQLASWWIEALHEAFAEIPAEVRRSATAMAVSGQQHGFVPVGSDGQVLAPVKLWCDTTTTAECEALMNAFGGERRCLTVLGNPIVTGYTAPKILWLKKHHPELFAQMRHVLLPHDYLNFHLSGEVAMEYGDASGTGLLNVRERCWNQEMVNNIDPGLMTCLPKLLPADARLGLLQPAIAEQLGLPAGIPIATGGGDNMMAAIGTGNVGNGVVTISLGSSGTVYSHSDKPITDGMGRLAAFCSSTGGWLPLLCTMNCTLSTELLRGLLDTDLEEFETALRETRPGANGVLTLPFFNGERTPNLPDAKGCILGLDSTNCLPRNLLRSATEGASYGLRLGIDALREQGVEVKEIHLTGGGSNSPGWRQMLADICQAPVTLLTPDEGAAFGAAMQALALIQTQAGQSVDINELVTEHLQKDPDRSCQPIAENVTLYENLYRNYLDAVETLTPWFQRR